MEKGTCPVCKGSKRKSCDPTKNQKEYRVYSGYDPETHTLPCSNCGLGMFARPSGEVRLRPDGTPCEHKFTSETIGRCYHKYTCIHCGEVFHIDSGD